mmetsp:Transcript_20042/g.42206  ORF Transcript_20042/g.42206 Transcript_20042/m.42206 type:complete len:248 (-) Transcript_20042:47-790(-)
MSCMPCIASCCCCCTHCCVPGTWPACLASAVWAPPKVIGPMPPLGPLGPLGMLGWRLWVEAIKACTWLRRSLTCCSSWAFCPSRFSLTWRATPSWSCRWCAWRSVACRWSSTSLRWRSASSCSSVRASGVTLEEAMSFTSLAMAPGAAIFWLMSGGIPSGVGVAGPTPPAPAPAPTPAPLKASGFLRCSGKGDAAPSAPLAAPLAPRAASPPDWPALNCWLDCCCDRTSCMMSLSPARSSSIVRPVP